MPLKRCLHLGSGPGSQRRLQRNEPAGQFREVRLENFPLHRAIHKQRAEDANVLGILLQQYAKLQKRKAELGSRAWTVESRLEALRDEIDRLLVRIAQAEFLQGPQVA